MARGYVAGMPRRHLSVRVRDDALARELATGFAQIRAELEIPEAFPAAVLAEAQRAVADPPTPAEDLTELPFLTIDPPGSTDLDQAMHLERRDGGYRLRYAIADVGGFVPPGGAIDREANRRGQTLYSPDTRTPLHPPVLSEGAASLLPGEVRPAVVWTFELGADGRQRAVDVRRALVRSRDRLDYAGVQAALDGGTNDERLVLLAEIGEVREALEVERGGVSLPLPEQQIEQVDGTFRLAYRANLPVEGFNEQVSLLTGMAAAQLMLEAGVGVLRTLPPAGSDAIALLRRAADGLGIDWPDGRSYAEVIAGVDATDPRSAAFFEEATTLLRGAGYTSFDGSPPELKVHAAVAASYAHATAPLRRLVDRYVSEVCLAVSAGTEVPDWVREALPALPERMAESDRIAGALERECLGLMEATVLRDSIGSTFEGVVVEVHEKGGGTVQLADPAVRAGFDGQLPLGQKVTVRLVEADVGKRSVRFAPA